MAFQFGTSGATPANNTSNPLGAGTLNLGGTIPPAAKALGGASGSWSLPAATPAPVNQPIKKQTTVSATGDTHTTEYHPPTPTPAVGNAGPLPGGNSPAPAQNQVYTPPQNSAPQQPQPYSSSDPVTYPGLIQNLANTSQQGSPYTEQAIQGILSAAQGNSAIGQRAADIAAQYGQQIANAGGQGARSEAGQLTTGTSPVGEGNAAVTAQTTAAQQQALAQGESAALQGTAQQLTGQNQQANAYGAAGGVANTAQGNVQSGLNNAAGYAQPQLGNIGSQQYYNPLNANSSSGAGTLPADATNAINSYAQAVKEGRMTRADAESRLSTYGITGLNALNIALGPTFNTNASNASAATTGQGQQIQTAAQSTNSALDTLSNAFSQLSSLQTGGIPASNGIANWIGHQFGDAALSQFKTNLADARSQLIGVLNSSGGTPTGNEATALQYLPDNMTKAQFDANVGTAQNPGIVRQLVAQKVSAFTGSGSQTGASGSPAGTAGGTWSW